MLSFVLIDDAKVRRFFIQNKKKAKLFAHTTVFLTHVNKTPHSLICIKFHAISLAIPAFCITFAL